MSAENGDSWSSWGWNAWNNVKTVSSSAIEVVKADLVEFGTSIASVRL